MKKVICIFWVLALGCSIFAGCNKKASTANPMENNISAEPAKPTEEVEDVKKATTVNLMENISAKIMEPADEVSLHEYGSKLNDFAVKLFNSCRTSSGNNGNTLVSPLSVVLALSMTANGADGETLAQMEKTLGIPKDELNRFAKAYMALLSVRNPEFGKLKLADSIWFTSDERFSVEQSFLQTNADYFGADIYKAPFDSSTLKAINDWVNEKTDTMIPSILDDIPDEAVMYLVNALAFDAKWAEPYYDYQVRESIFTTDAGKEEVNEYLYGEENRYLEDEKATGFVKYYEGYQYAFAALLPNEGISVDEYLDSIDGAHLSEMLESRKNNTVYTAMPKFKTEYSVEMSDQLKGMGMTDAFNAGAANFKKIGTSKAGNIIISKVMHKTFIEVDENGTKAGAATVVMMENGAALSFEEPKKVYLTRPFVYMLIDTQTNSPFFIGVMRDLEG